MRLVYIENNRPITDSLIVAETFGKRHSDVLRDIEVQIEKLSEAGMSDWGLRNFALTTYEHPQNKQTYPKYNLTEDAFAIVAMSYVTPEAMKMKVKFLTEFRRMKEQLTAQMMSPMEMIAMIAKQAAEKEKEDARRDQQIAVLQSGVTQIQETIIQRDEDWRNWINKMFNNAVVHTRGKDFQAIRRDSYNLLQQRARCDLDARLRNLRGRLEREGATKTKINSLTKMDVIEADVRLKEIYTSIVKELSIKLVPLTTAR